MLRRSLMLSLPAFSVAVMLQRLAGATEDSSYMKHFSDALADARTSATSTARTAAAERLFALTGKMNPNDVNDKTIVDLMSLLAGSDDSTRYWAARSLGVLGPRAKIAVPILQSTLTEVDCLPGSKTSASGIRFALLQIGITPPPYSCKSRP